MPLLENLVAAVPRWATAFPVLRNLVPASARKAIYQHLLDRAIEHYPDRVYLRECIIPAVIARSFTRVLSVGVQRYTRQTVHQLVRGGVEVWTMDIDPSVARWGAPGRHLVGDAQKIDRIAAAHGFPCILFNGVLGYGIDAPDDVGAMLRKLAALLPPEGLLVLGWNTDRMEDPAHRPEFRAFQPFDHAGLGQRITFPRSTHVYDCLTPVSE